VIDRKLERDMTRLRARLEIARVVEERIFDERLPTGSPFALKNV